VLTIYPRSVPTKCGKYSAHMPQRSHALANNPANCSGEKLRRDGEEVAVWE